MRIALDIMGGDFAPGEIIKGLKLALSDFPDVQKFLLVGDSEQVADVLIEHDLSVSDPRLEIIHASQVVGMDDASSVAVRRKKNSSIAVAAKLISEEKADAVVSAGHTGAAVASMIVTNRMLPGIDRPGIAGVFPAPDGPFIMLDVGANVDSKPMHLAQYGILGEAYSKVVLRVKNPKIGLLSIGTEDKKGNDLTREAYQIMAKLPINFVGNVEGNDLFGNQVDVVVCDGFVGNTVLKSCEGLAKAISKILKSSLKKSAVRRAGALLSKNAFKELKELTDHEEYGGAPLLGTKGICIIAHGSSSSKAIRNAIRVAREMVKNQINEKISDKISGIDWTATGNKA